MANHATSLEQRRSVHRERLAGEDYLLRQGILKLLAVKDSDIRLLTLEQCREAVDKGLHAGGAFSATIPLVALYYGGFIDYDIADPTRKGQDLFTLSKGHAVAALAAVYADLGYFDRSILHNSRSYESILNGHPGPVLPGVHIATGPMGQGFGVAQGFAIAGRVAPRFDSYAMCGDGELQEGPIWEAVMFAGAKKLDNLCLLVDRNYGQLDIHTKTIFPMPELEPVFESFGWQAHRVDSTQYEGVYAALEAFRHGPRNGKPTAIICHSSKGYGALSDFLNKHKVTVADKLTAQEMDLQLAQRNDRVWEFSAFYRRLSEHENGSRIRETLGEIAAGMHLDLTVSASGEAQLRQQIGPVALKRVPPRDKKIRYDAAQLPKFDKSKEYAASDVVAAAMKEFAKDSRVVSIDSDLASTSGLEAGVGSADQRRALNAGVAEANMMLIGEAFAALGCNTWISTFCPFFDWKVLRRVAVGHQERLEAMESADGWLSEGHGLDLTMLATAADFETRTNGATHMGNDDCIVFDAIGQVRIVNVSCPRQMLAVMQWIMEGNRGLVYVRLMRTGSAVIYGEDYRFEFGKGHVLRQTAGDRIVLAASGRGVHEGLAAAALCEKRGIGVTVVDLPSFDAQLLLELYDSGKPILFAEQNNGFLWQKFLKALHQDRRSNVDLGRVLTINTLDAAGKPRFIHSGTYEELTEAFGLNAARLADAISERVKL